MSNFPKESILYPWGVECDWVFFFELLKNSLSLGVDEKVRLIRKLPALSQWQVAELIDVMVTECAGLVRFAQESDEARYLTELTKKAHHSWQLIDECFDLPQLAMSPEEFSRKVGAHLNVLDSLLMIPTASELAQSNDCLPQEASHQAEPQNNNNSKDPCQNLQAAETDSKEESSEAQESYHWLEKFNLADYVQQHANDHIMPDPPFVAIDKLKCTIIGQDAALEKLTALFYYQRLFELKQRLEADDELYIGVRPLPLLLIGNTGTGKTHLIKGVARHYRCKMTMIDSATMVRTGIVGTNLDTIGRMIYEAADHNLKKAEYAIVFFDEFDKLFLKDSDSGSYEGIASQLLTILEGSMPIPVEQPRGSDRIYPTHIDTSKMMFVLSGSFGIQKKRDSRPSIGFHERSDKHPIHYDQLFLTELGVPDELAGRIGQVIYLEELDDLAYQQILYYSPTSPWTTLKQKLVLVSCTVELPEAVVRHLIDSHRKQIATFGARGLYQAFNALPCISCILINATKQPNQHFVIDLTGVES